MITRLPVTSADYPSLHVIPQGFFEISSEINEFLKMHVVNFAFMGFADKKNNKNLRELLSIEITRNLSISEAKYECTTRLSLQSGRKPE